MIFVSAGQPSADAVAALFVAALVVAAGLRLARQSVDVLMDRTELGAEDRIRAALARLAEPLELRRIRVRQAAGRHFADLVVAVPSDAGVTQAHAIADDVERVVEESLPGADVVVHIEPSETSGDLRELATAGDCSRADPRGGEVRLSEAELRLLGLLPGELCYREIAGELNTSRSTACAPTQAVSAASSASRRGRRPLAAPARASCSDAG